MVIPQGHECKQYFALLYATMIVIVGTATSSGQFVLDERLGPVNSSHPAMER